MAEMLPPIVFDAWLRSRGVSRVAPVTGGLSGALVFRATAESVAGGEAPGAWAVRGWPEGTSPQRVAEVHRVVRLARREGCDLIPEVVPADPSVAGGEGSTHVVAAGRVWECCQWMPGRAPRSADDLVGALRQAAGGVARFHRATSSLGTHCGPVPAVLARVQRLFQLEPMMRQLQLRSEPAPHSPHAPTRPSLQPAASTIILEEAADVLRFAWPRQHQRHERLLEPWTTRPLRQQYALRDIHLENALFVAGRLSGIVDCDAIRIDSPATDMARLVGSAALLRTPVQGGRAGPLPWSTLWSETLAAYRAVRTFSTEEEQLARVLAEVSPLVTLANWVAWIMFEGRAFPGSAAVVDRRIAGWAQVVREQCDRSKSPGVES